MRDPESRERWRDRCRAANGAALAMFNVSLPDGRPTLSETLRPLLGMKGTPVWRESLPELQELLLSHRGQTRGDLG